MPYLNGDRTVDASGNGLLDAISNAIQTPPFDFSGLVTWVRTLYDNVVGTGHGDFWEGIWRIIVSGLTGNPEWLTVGYTDPDVTESFSRIGFLYNWLEPGGSDPGSIRTQLIAAIQAVRTDTATPHAATVQDVLDAIAAAPTVTLPTPPPAGYEPPTVAEIWGHALNGILGGGVTADEGVSTAWLLHNYLAQYASIPIRGSRFFSVDFLSASGGAYPTSHTEMVFDVTDILADDTVLSWLTRTDTSGREWALDPVTGMVRTGTNLGNEYHTYIYCLLTDADLQAIRAGYAAGSAPASGLPPVWPGIDNVTLGTTLPCTITLEFEGACDGVLIAIISTSWGASQMIVGDDRLYRGIGRMAFRSDNGQLEGWQSIPSNECIMTPKTMNHSSGFVIGFYHTVDAAVTPWTLNV